MLRKAREEGRAEGAWAGSDRGRSAAPPSDQLLSLPLTTHAPEAAPRATYRRGAPTGKHGAQRAHQVSCQRGLTAVPSEAEYGAQCICQVISLGGQLRPKPPAALAAAAHPPRTLLRGNHLLQQPLMVRQGGGQVEQHGAGLYLQRRQEGTEAQVRGE